MKRSKKYKEARKLVDSKKHYTLDETLKLIPKVSTSKFDASIELHILLQLTDKQKKESIKGSLILPHKVGHDIRVAVITKPEQQEEASEADIVGFEDLIKKIEEGEDNFDVLIATPDVMSKLASLGKILGPKGKMPNPKNGTVTKDIKKTIKSYKEGKLNFRADKQGGIHQMVGKVSMKKEDIKENVKSFLKVVSKETKKYNPIPFKSVHMAPSMGPGIKLDITSLMKELT